MTVAQLSQFQEFRILLNSCAELAMKAQRLDVSDLYQTQARTITRLCAQLYRPPIDPDASDAEHMEKELRYITNEVCEPILTAMAEEARQNFSGISTANAFKDHLSDALGDIGGELQDAAQELLEKETT